MGYLSSGNGHLAGQTQYPLSPGSCDAPIYYPYYIAPSRKEYLYILYIVFTHYVSTTTNKLSLPLKWRVRIIPRKFFRSWHCCWSFSTFKDIFQDIFSNSRTFQHISKIDVLEFQEIVKTLVLYPALTKYSTSH